VPKLLELLEITGAVVTLDAMHCQKKTAAKIREQGADYILQVKNNQPSLFRELEEIFHKYGEENYESRACRVHRKRERNRGRSEVRICIVAPAPASWKRRRLWKDIQTVGMIYRHREVNGVASDEVSYFISSLPPKVRLHSKHIRSHWSVENTLHWSLDVTFAEDSSRIRKGFAPEIASMFRRLALTILQRDTTLQESIRGKRLIAGWNCEALSEGIWKDKWSGLWVEKEGYFVRWSCSTRDFGVSFRQGGRSWQTFPHGGRILRTCQTSSGRLWNVSCRRRRRVGERGRSIFEKL